MSPDLTPDHQRFIGAIASTIITISLIMLVDQLVTWWKRRKR